MTRNIDTRNDMVRRRTYVKTALTTVTAIAISLLTFLLVACSNNNDDEAADASEVGASASITSAGEAIFKNNCRICHAQGLNGAPIIGNTTMWGPRVEQGIPVLVEHASQGFGMMPAKGGNMDLTDAEIESAVRFMLSKLID